MFGGEEDHRVSLRARERVRGQMAGIRKTSRVTNSTSVTGPGLPTMASTIPPDLIRQARLDLADDSLWLVGDQPNMREALRNLLACLDNAGALTEEELIKIYNLVHGSDRHRRRWAVVPPTPVPPPSTPPPPAARVTEPIVEPPPASSPSPDPSPHASPIRLPLDYNCPQNATQIAEGFGLKNGTVVARLERDYPDWPAPVPKGTERRWRLLDVLTWGQRHEQDVRDAREGKRMTPKQLRDQIAALKAEVARQKERP
jgi:hypothetical protein